MSLSVLWYSGNGKQNYEFLSKRQPAMGGVAISPALVAAVPRKIQRPDIEARPRVSMDRKPYGLFFHLFLEVFPFDDLYFSHGRPLVFGAAVTEDRDEDNRKEKKSECGSDALAESP